MKVGLGTAQFGLDYGISNHDGQVAPVEALKILDLAERAGVRVLDTAAAYGDSEERLGEMLATDHPFSIVTKLSRLPEGLTSSATTRWVQDAVAQSLRRLRTDHVRGLLVHDVGDLLGARGTDLWHALESVRDAGTVEKIGASLYTAAEIDALLERHRPQLVQVPLNVFDQRLILSGHLAHLKTAGVEVHSRSSFLQGLLLMDPTELSDPYFEPARGALDAFRTAARATGYSPLQAAVSFVMSLDEVDVTMFGVINEGQLAEILSATTLRLPSDWFMPFSLDDVSILNPALWPP